MANVSYSPAAGAVENHPKAQAKSLSGLKQGEKTQYNADRIVVQSIILYCMDTFKINDEKIHKNALRRIENNPPLLEKRFGKWILSLKVLTDSCEVNKYIFSQLQLFYFLTVAIKGIDQDKIGSELLGDTTFYIYKDILNNYESSHELLKLSYPGIIIDVISILHKGIDTQGKKVTLDFIPSYFESRKASKNNHRLLASSRVI